MLGHQLCKILAEDNDNRVATTIRKNKSELAEYPFYQRIKVYDNLEISNEKLVALENVITEFQPNIIINATGLFANQNTSNSDLNFINSILPHKIYDICKSILKKYFVITISTDGVFNGDKGSYTESDLTDATDSYGISKILGELHEENALTIRTSIYGPDPFSHKGLLEWFLHSNKSIEGYTNVYFSGVNTVYLSKVIACIIKQKNSPRGILHVHSERISKYNLLLLFKKHFTVKKIITAQNKPFRDLSLVSERKLYYKSFSHEQMISELTQG